jgi:DNA-binding transcriptional ArsR family regulator
VRVYGPRGVDKRATFAVWSGIVAHSATIAPPAAPAHDYEADELLVVSEPAQLRALGDEIRGRIIGLLRERARSATELAALLEMPKGTVGHHLKVLERARLIHVVRTRQVRAVTEKYYGRVARLFLMKSADEAHDELVYGAGATALRNAASELAAAPEVAMHGLIRVRLGAADVKRFNRRLDRLLMDVREANAAEGEPWGVATAMYRLEER